MLYYENCKKQKKSTKHQKNPNNVSTSKTSKVKIRENTAKKSENIFLADTKVNSSENGIGNSTSRPSNKTEINKNVPSRKS